MPHQLSYRDMTGMESSSSDVDVSISSTTSSSSSFGGTVETTRINQFNVVCVIAKNLFSCKTYGNFPLVTILQETT